MRSNERETLRKELEDRQLPFRLIRGANTVKLRRDGWLRCVRQAAGIPVDEVARRLGVCRWEVHRLEDSERNARIMLETLNKAAKGLGCQLVYALVPLAGTLKEKADEREREREFKRHPRELQRTLDRQPWLEEIGWKESFMKATRTQLRRDGIRVRPRKTERGVDEQLAEFEQKMKLVEMGEKAAAAMRGADGNKA